MSARVIEWQSAVVPQCLSARVVYRVSLEECYCSTGFECKSSTVEYYCAAVSDCWTARVRGCWSSAVLRGYVVQEW